MIIHTPIVSEIMRRSIADPALYRVAIATARKLWTEGLPVGEVARRTGLTTKSIATRASKEKWSLEREALKLEVAAKTPEHDPDHWLQLMRRDVLLTYHRMNRMGLPQDRKEELERERLLELLDIRARKAYGITESTTSVKLNLSLLSAPVKPKMLGDLPHAALPGPVRDGQTETIQGDNQAEVIEVEQVTQATEPQVD